MKTVTQAQRKQREKCDIAIQAAQRAIFAFGPNSETRFSDCWDLASEDAKANYVAAIAARDDLEALLISESRGFRGVTGMFHSF